MATSDPLIGQTLGDYVIQDLLGQGGMARVYKGYDSALDRYAAVKVIEPNLLASEDEEDYRQRFQREARSIARLDHPNIVSIYQFGQNETKTLYYMAMGFVDGQNLREVLKKLNQSKKHMNHAYILRVMRDIGSALDYAHQQGVIHRDVKTSNIMLTKSGQAVLTDFGLALNAQEGTLGNTFGSVHYIAPEQALSSKQAVPQSDLYSLGIVLFEMLTGRVPFEDVSAMSVALKHISDPPPMPSTLNVKISPQVEDVIMKALDKEPRKRFNTGQTFVMALEGAFAVSDDEDTHDLENDSPSLWTSASVEDVLEIGGEDSAEDQQSRTRHSSPPPEVVTGASAGSSVMDESPTIRESSRKHPIFAEIEAKADTKHPKSTLHVQDEPNRGIVYALVGLFVAVIVLAVGGLLLFGGGGEDNGDGEDTIALNASSTASGGAALLEVTEEATPPVTSASASTEEATEEATSQVTSTSASIEEATEEATRTPTEAATEEVTEETTNTATATEDSTATLTSTARPTDTPTENPTNTPTEAATVTPAATATPEPSPTEAQPAEIRLIYDGRTLVLLNQSERRLDLDGIDFVRLTSDDADSIVYAVEEWNTRAIYSLRPGNCLQVWTTSFVQLEDDEPPATACGSRVRFRQTIHSFWVTTGDHPAFEVRRDGAVLATCEVIERVYTIDHEGLPRMECLVSLGEQN